MHVGRRLSSRLSHVFRYGGVFLLIHDHHDKGSELQGSEIETSEWVSYFRLFGLEV